MLMTSRSSPIQQRLRFLCLPIAAALLGCVESIEHDPARAAKKAEEFVQVAFAKSDGVRGYGMLAPATKRYVSLEQFKRVVARMHPQAAPKSVRVLELEPMKGEKAIYVYLSGENSGEWFHYRITLEGTAKTDYGVLKFERSNEPYTGSTDRKKLGE
jgi:hypothetical protein